MDFDGCTFLSACAVDFELIWFALEVDHVAEQSGPNSSFIAWDGTDWTKYDEAGGWPALAMATIKPSGGIRTVVAIGPRGEYWELEPLSMNEQLGRIEDVRHPVRGVRAIADSIYLCGMGRTAMIRQEKGRWVDIGPKTKSASDEIVGFEDMDGFSEGEIYAVGWLGEIWWRDKGRWRQVDSPVSANLNAIHCASDGVAYVVGDGGVMLRGRKDEWEAVATGRGENLMDVAMHLDKVYVVTDFRILVLKGKKLVNDNNFAEPTNRPATCLHLVQASDAVFSVGTKDIFRLVDKGWERLT